MCSYALGPYEPCSTCKHCRAELCGLAMAAVPPTGMGCCHHNADLLSGEQELSDEIYLLFGDYYLTDRASEQMDTAGVPYTLCVVNRVEVNPDDTMWPEMFGRGTNHD